ncbi:MAG: hypothetical protein QM323_11595 [Acidobacteriota bacterium]|nr:hypothetical protein [Acidobacteriota bacterium]
MTETSPQIWSFSIPGSLPSLNQYTQACRSDARVGARLKRQVEAIVKVAAATQCPPAFSGPVFLTFAWHESSRRRDLDNVAFAKKFVLDALVALGVLPDDGRRYVTGFADEFHLDRRDPRVVVTIERRP